MECINRMFVPQGLSHLFFNFIKYFKVSITLVNLYSWTELIFCSLSHSTKFNFCLTWTLNINSPFFTFIIAKSQYPLLDSTYWAYYIFWYRLDLNVPYWFDIYETLIIMIFIVLFVCVQYLIHTCFIVMFSYLLFDTIWYDLSHCYYLIEID